MSKNDNGEGRTYHEKNVEVFSPLQTWETTETRRYAFDEATKLGDNVIFLEQNAEAFCNNEHSPLTLINLLYIIE